MHALIGLLSMFHFSLSLTLFVFLFFGGILEEEVVDVEAVVKDVEAVVEVVLRLMIDHPSHLKTHLEFKEFSKSFRDVVEEMVAEMVVEEEVMVEEGVMAEEGVEVMEEDVEEEEVKKGVEVWQVGERLAVLEEVMQVRYFILYTFYSERFWEREKERYELCNYCAWHQMGHVLFCE